MINEFSAKPNLVNYTFLCLLPSILSVTVNLESSRGNK